MNLRRNVRSWLFWLALLLPIAQAVAGVHALSHVTGERQEAGIVHLVHCDLCLTAANLAGGAPAAGPAVLPAGVPAATQAAAPQSPALGRDSARRPPARAPPASA